ncbi:MAG: ABC transporter permease, partial [Chloroflexota bacterium]
MSEKSQALEPVASFERSGLFSWRAPSLPSLPMIGLLLVVGFLVLTPLFLMILNSFQIARPGQPIVWGMEGWIKAFSTPGIVKAMTNTFTLAIARQSIALVVGSFFAWLIARTDIPMKRTLEFFFWLSFFLPALPETMGWILFLDPKYGLLNQALISLGIVSQPLFNIYSFWGIVWAHMGGTIAVKVMLLAPAFRNLDAALEEASKISGASGWRTFFHIVIPVMMPAILVTTILGTIRSLEAFEIELLLGTPIGLQVYSTKIHELVTWEPPQFAPAMALSTLFLGILLLMVALQRRFIARRNYETITGRGFSIRPTLLGRWRYPAFGLVLSFAMV